MSIAHLSLRKALFEAFDLSSLDKAVGLPELTYTLSAEVENAIGSRDHRDSSQLNTLLLLAAIQQNKQLAETVSKLGDDITSLRESIAASKAAPTPSDPLIVQKLDTLIGRTSLPPPTPQAPHRPTPPAKPAQPRATPMYAQVVRSTPNSNGDCGRRNYGAKEYNRGEDVDVGGSWTMDYGAEGYT
ncbi:uncharacterized protein H6S33_009915 [Morchella sextelata]|uniref:uncharacterized protein n=1 Tax=Morchella sextelata TaxID=1174677 RepID=UPI001D050D19|nr:uncharacterized protein H6S33_009915 [Morchella sextelata]KAH0602216.1 hypothetical protein H6S33_009915 [Morchella sextelata]